MKCNCIGINPKSRQQEQFNVFVSELHYQTFHKSKFLCTTQKVRGGATHGLNAKKSA